jgi:hypothetical protein
MNGFPESFPRKTVFGKLGQQEFPKVPLKSLKSLVPRGGVEPPTHGFSAPCSTADIKGLATRFLENFGGLANFRRQSTPGSFSSVCRPKTREFAYKRRQTIGSFFRRSNADAECPGKRADQGQKAFSIDAAPSIVS